ncbi:MAG: GMC oxidoreductase [Gemmatimonadales bacterium]
MRVLVVGSGASGVHFALTALERGFRVTMIDVGHERPEAPLPEASVEQLKERLEDPVAYFVGERGQGVAYPATKASFYGHPPSKDHVFRKPPGFVTQEIRMAPVYSFARGGLAEAWTAGSYELGPDDLREFPIDRAALAAGYRTVARRIGVGAAHDDLARFIPTDAEYLEPLPLDEHSALLLARYARRREGLQRGLRFHLGRSRVATLSRPHAGRPACAELGRCFWGCPIDAIYSPRVTLQECLRHPGFDYRPGRVATHFEYDDEGRVIALATVPVEGGEAERLDADRYVLAAGALASSKLVLDTIHRRTGRVERLTGLMDNRQVHVPFLTPAMIGRQVELASYQFHHLAFALERPDPAEYIHGQITTLRAASTHPVIASLPLDGATGLRVFRRLRGSLALANVNLHDTRREGSWLSIRPSDQGRSALLVQYTDDPAEAELIGDALARTRRAVRRLGGFVPPGMTRVLPKGFSVHYAGTLPFSRERRRFGADPNGRSWDFPNLFFADGATFPFLPAKNLTFTLMANATRIAEALA